MTGLDTLLGALKKLQNETLPTLGRALYEEATDVANKADMLVPYDTGNLARSQIVHHPQMAGDTVFVDITYGGVAKAYALVQHENLNFSHPSKASGLPPNGRQAKYLEDPARMALIGLNYRLNIRVEAIIRGLV
jgi:hypothetical protein